MNMSGIRGDNIFVVPSGLDIRESVERSGKPHDPAIGFFSRVSYNNGFDKLADAFIMLKKEKEFSSLLLNVCGGYTSDDKPFISEQIHKVREAGFKSSVKIYPGFVGRGKREFLDSIDVLSVPVRKYDGYGLYILEANASGIPVVQPATGAFPEILNLTQGGILYSPDDVDTLASNLRLLLGDSERADKYGSEGKKRVTSFLTHQKMAEGMYAVYKSIRS
jgi:glycosyltransferase involved in cell wall biosynthesis